VPVPSKEYFGIDTAYFFLLLSLGQYLSWWTISRRGYHPPSSQCFSIDMAYLVFISITGVDTTVGGLIVTEGIIRPVFSASVLT
jgi:hypothetical protein